MPAVQPARGDLSESPVAALPFSIGAQAEDAVRKEDHAILAPGSVRRFTPDARTGFHLRTGVRHQPGLRFPPPMGLIKIGGLGTSPAA
ncbi:MAG: hypothetical protein ABI177_09575 [Edaphobacter sp.]